MNLSALEEALEKLMDREGIHAATVVTRSGMHLAGRVPTGAHQETFVAMSAILLGAAETATSELREDLVSIQIDLHTKSLLVMRCTQKALLAIIVDAGTIPSELILDIGDELGAIEANL